MSGRATLRRLATMLLVVGAFNASATAALAQDGPPPPAGLGVKLLQGPAGGVDNPRAHEYVVDHLTPGTTITRQVGFSNGDAAPIDLDFYAAAADLTDDGFIVRPGHAASDLTSWITFDPASATVQPGETRAVTVTIAVPADATRGERYAAALAERSTAPATNGVVTVSRVGIRLYLSVGPGGEPTTAFSIDSFTASRDASRSAVVTASVHNTGERAVDLSGELSLSNGPSSLSAGPFPTRDMLTLAPGASGTVTVQIDGDLPDGPWEARLALTSGLTTEVGTGTITFPSERATSAAPARVEASGQPPLAPVATAGAVVALLAVASSAFRWRRRARRAARQAPPRVEPSIS